ncbi:acyl-CoA dehydrogenase family protein [Picrophilus oshimae]|uniref:Acyl-CoA dehydrogenase n=1 Tax=Picrophilus torridus (strain ATCC 700027 / DSM 9790 / JCM 10055 / NBRC 100828 / KAW 2/3) TaxID=1122961 RepID=A0A8G2L812_PICTO|nr:acyl-CoA dehydrogenase family protein [Picrophilus oshimae]SMD30885.1 acyl-CoA dehydrogenase [Picrophilus oshimae DSM 9789]
MKFDFSNIFLSRGVNYFNDDKTLHSIMKYLNYHDDALADMGLYISSEMIEDSMFIDHYAKPVLKTWGILDNEIEGVWISRDHKNIIERLLDMGVVSRILDKDLMFHFTSGYLISDSGLFCTLTLTGQTVYALKKYSNNLNDFIEHYRNDHWLGATYYTEIQGGSDLGANKTVAVSNGDSFILNGENKYFASDAGLADGAIVTARLNNKPGVKGISVFFVPALKPDGSPNYNIRRLKDKLGTILVPTGEVILNNSIGYMLGNDNNGIYIALEILEISRIDDALAAAGIARKALWESYLYSLERHAFGKAIIKHPLIIRDLIEMQSEVDASTVLSFIAADMFSKVTDEEPPYHDDYHMARAFTHMAKNISSWASDHVTRYAMEIFGGKGFLYDFPVEKFHRDSIVTSLWEGTSNIQALDFLEILIKKKIDKRIISIINDIIKDLSKENADILSSALRRSLENLESMLSSGKTEYFAKDILNTLGHLSALAFMLLISEKTGNMELSISGKIYYYRHFLNSFPYDFDFNSASRILHWMKRI